MASISFSFVIESAPGEEAPFSFPITVADWVGPWMVNLSPEHTASGLDGYQNISFDILDDTSGVDISSIDAYLNGQLIFSNSSFLSPWNGPNSEITEVNVDGYDGYHFNFDPTDPLTANSLYEFTISGKDYSNNNLVPPIIWTFTTGTDISNITVGEYEINILVTFGLEMTPNANLLEPSNYVFDKGMYTRYVEIVDAKTVKLWVERFSLNDAFQLTVSNVSDIYGGIIPTSYNKITISPFTSTADISNYNGLIRTWKIGNVIQADDNNIYIAGNKGIDVFRKLTKTNIVKWGQIFDSYGVISMFAANFPNSLTIQDTTIPYLSNQNPAPNTLSSIFNLLEFTIRDIDTATEITSTSVYLNGILAFNGGYGGWQNEYKGNISISYKALNFVIKPPTPFTSGDVVVVRVVATDLLGNTLDKTYQYSVGTGELTEGWGAEEWGVSPWGGF